MLTYKVTKRGVLGADGKELAIGNEIKFPRAVSKPWSDRLELIIGADSKAEVTTQVDPEPATEPEPDGIDDEEEIDLDTISEDDLRQLAKEHGIKSWHNKAPEKLKEELLSLAE